MNQQGDTPVVKKGESLQEWLGRAVPYLIQTEKLGEEEAKKIASSAWEKVNSTQPDPAQQSTPSAQSSTQSTPKTNVASTQRKNGVAPKPEWNNSNSWGVPPGENMNSGADDEVDVPEDIQADAGVEESGAQSATGWFADQLEGYANALKERMVAVGHFDGAQSEAIARAIEEAMDHLHDSIEALTAMNGDSFGFEISVPPPGFFNRAPSAKKSMIGRQRGVSSLPPANPAQAAKVVYMRVDESSPVDGYVVALKMSTQSMRIPTIDELTVADIEQFIADNSAMVTDGAYLSGQIDSDSGEVVLGWSVVVPEKEQAEALARQYQSDEYLDIVASQLVAVTPAGNAQSSQDSGEQKATYLSKFFTTKGFQGPYVLRLPNRFTAMDGDLAIKSVGKNRVGNYLCVWGSQSESDLSGEWFSPKTQELTAVFDAVGVVPALYHHAMDKSLKSAVIGLVDRMERDDTGLWVEAQVREHEMYKRMIMPLIHQKKLGWSSGTLPGAREVNKSTGEIKRWAIVEATMTPTPMEWRMAVQWQVQNIKSAYQGVGLDLPDFTFNPAARDAEIQSELARIEALVRKF